MAFVVRSGNCTLMFRDLRARACNPAQPPIGFFRPCTLKEAYIKATGLGLAQRPDDFAFAFEPLRVTFADAALGEADGCSTPESAPTEVQAKNRTNIELA